MSISKYYLKIDVLKIGNFFLKKIIHNPSINKIVCTIIAYTISFLPFYNSDHKNVFHAYVINFI